MTAPIDPLLPGEELMDADTFFALYSHRAESAGTREAAPCSSSWPVLELTEDDVLSPGRGSERARLERHPAEEPGGFPAPPSSPAVAAALEAEIDGCSARPHVVRLAVHLARAYASVAALLLVRGGVIQGIHSEGWASSAESVLFPADAASLFADVAASGKPYRGAASRQALDQRILRALGRHDAQEIAVFPIAVRGRVVNLLYADNGPEALGDASFAALGALCARVSRAYERLILERKRAAAGVR